MGTWRSIAGLAGVLAAASASGAFAQGAGFITGRLMYPADSLPADLRVCADDIDMGGQTCTTQRIRGSQGWSYRLAVPAGRYHVWASSREMSGYKAYYTEFVTCGLDVSCRSHKRIEVEVRPGETTVNVSPADWYDN